MVAFFPGTLNDSEKIVSMKIMIIITNDDINTKDKNRRFAYSGIFSESELFI